MQLDVFTRSFTVESVRQGTVMNWTY